MIELLNGIEWIVTALVALAVTLIAFKAFKLSPVWSLAIGMAVFTVLNFPIPTHAVWVEMPRRSN
jgi:hypothetical protein